MQQGIANQYEHAIQVAFREVADALSACGTVDQQVAAQQSLVRELAETHRLASSRFDPGIDGYLSILDAQRSLFAAQQALVVLRLEELGSRVCLYAVLGGGGSPRDQVVTSASSGRPSGCSGPKRRG